VCAACLIALGSNLGDRAARLRAAVDELSRLPRSRLVARSSWRETPPIGGPGGQGAFLNGAALVDTALDPRTMLAELARIEQQGERVRKIRWDARTLDLDLMLYGDQTWQATDLVVPHPRMHYRRFVLEPAAEIAPWMIHPTSGWTVSRLLQQLDNNAATIAVAAADSRETQQLVAYLVEQLASPAAFGATGVSTNVVRWTLAEAGCSPEMRPQLLLAVGDVAGSAEVQMRKMLNLPASGPVAWLAPGAVEVAAAEALTVIASAWPQLAPTTPHGS
jgi:2-amino-4-hydroxy-6-hydroxymethyldihydropteridine diphosphokinase